MKIWNSLLGTFRLKRKQYQNCDNFLDDCSNESKKKLLPKWKYFDELKFLETNYEYKDFLNGILTFCSLYVHFMSLFVDSFLLFNSCIFLYKLIQGIIISKSYI